MKIAFVVPWYSERNPGGAETEAKRTAENLSHSGIEVEILTTCVKSFYSDWSINYYHSGNEIINGLVTKRFPVNKRNTSAFDAVNYKLMNNQKVTSSEENVYIEEMLNSPDLYRYIKENSGIMIISF